MCIYICVCVCVCVCIYACVYVIVYMDGKDTAKGIAWQCIVTRP